MGLLRFMLSLVAAYFVAVAVLCLVYLMLPPVSAVMLASYLRGDGMQREWVALPRISPSIQRAVIVSEDARFCDHHGIDWKAVDTVVNQAQRQGKLSRGASTITMQVAKNLFLSNDRSVVRKLLEAPIALGIDALWPKRRILEVYLNIAQWGPGIFGIEAAAKRAYGVSAAQLSAEQAAMLAIVLPAPESRNAARPGPAMQGMASTVAARAPKANTRCLR